MSVLNNIDGQKYKSLCRKTSVSAQKYSSNPNSDNGNEVLGVIRARSSSEQKNKINE